MSAALMIVDMQQGYAPLIWRFDERARTLDALARRAREQGIPVFIVQQTGPPGTELAQDAPGWQVSELIEITGDDLRVRKTATDSFHLTGLDGALRARRIDRIVLGGIATDYCIDHTARAAISRGFDLDLVADGHAPAIDGDPETGLTAVQVIAHHEAILSAMVHPGGVLRIVAAADVELADSSGGET